MYENRISVFLYRESKYQWHYSDRGFFFLFTTFSGDEDVSSSTREPIPSVLVGVTAVVTIAAVILGCIHRTKSNG